MKINPLLSENLLFKTPLIISLIIHIKEISKVVVSEKKIK